MQSVHIRRWLESTDTVRQLRSHQIHIQHSNTPPASLALQSNIQDSGSASQDHGSKSKALSIATTVKADNRLTDDKLRTRRVIRERENDPKKEFLESLIQTELPALSLSKAPKIKVILDQHVKELEGKQSSSYYTFVDKLCLALDENKKEVGYPIIPSEYFEELQRKCASQNEVMLQRTIMINIFHPYWVNQMLDYNTEGTWSLPKEACLPSTLKNTVRMPKPDLAMSFKMSTLTVDEDGADPIPADLAHCLYPDGGFQCFPFLFMEVKKAGADLADAERDNLYNASQALYNIYQWMREASEQNEFFDKVRVLSFVFNVKELSVRVHRAVRSSNQALRFVFDDLYTLPRYTRDQACLLLNSLLENYAIKTLHPILKKTFSIIVQKVQQEQQSGTSKRTATNAQSDSGSKRRRTTRSENQNERTGQSFGTARLNITE